MSESDRVVMITGAGSGIGAATAELFANLNSQLILIDIEEDSLKDISAKLKEKAAGIIPMIVDVSSPEQVQNCIKKIEMQFGKLDVLVNNAGISNRALLNTADHTLEDWDRVIAVNQSGVFFCMKYALQ